MDKLIHDVYRVIDEHPDCRIPDICDQLFRDGYGLTERKQVGCAISYLIRDGQISKHQCKRPYYRTVGL